MYVIDNSRCASGVVGLSSKSVNLEQSYKSLSSQRQLESCAEECDSHVDERERTLESIPSSTVHVKYRMNPPGPSGKAKYCSRPIVNKYGDGKAKRTVESRVK
jgi:hypothetical protein